MNIDNQCYLLGDNCMVVLESRSQFVSIMVPQCDGYRMNVGVNAFYAILVDKYCIAIFFRNFFLYTAHLF